MDGEDAISAVQDAIERDDDKASIEAGSPVQPGSPFVKSNPDRVLEKRNRRDRDGEELLQPCSPGRSVSSSLRRSRVSPRPERVFEKRHRRPEWDGENIHLVDSQMRPQMNEEKVAPLQSPSGRYKQNRVFPERVKDAPLLKNTGSGRSGGMSMQDATIGERPQCVRGDWCKLEP